MKAQTAVPMADTNIVPDRNAGIGSLLLDLQDSKDPGRDGPPLLGREFAFIDVGASRALVSTTLKTLLTRDLGMDVIYVATELPEAVPSAHVTPLGARAEEVRGYLSRLISSKASTREVQNWHYVVDSKGKVSSLAYAYDLHGNEVWESYYMGRSFMVSGEEVEFADSTLDQMLAPDVRAIETGIDLERKRDSGPDLPAPSWDGYRVEKDPLQTGLAEFGIALQVTDVPARINGCQNVLFLGNVLNHYPQGEQARALNRIAANMQDGDIVIVQVDETATSFIDVLRVTGQGARKTRERVRWIDTRKLEVQRLARGPGSSRQIHMEPAIRRMAGGLIAFLGRKASSPEWSQGNRKVLVDQYVTHVFKTFFRALPAERTLRTAIREALRRLPSEGGPKGAPVFKDDASDTYGGALGLDSSPIVSEADLVHLLRIGSDEGSIRTRGARTTPALCAMALSFLLPAGAAAQAATSQSPAGPAGAGASTVPSASELAKQTQNPIASLISFPLEANWDMGVGDRKATATLLNVQPVIPFGVSKSTNVVLRVIMPLTSQPTSEADGSRISGFGDIVFSTFFTPARSGRLIWGVGPVLLLPTATNGALGSEKFGLGPTAVLLVQPGKWSVGMLVNQIWSTSGAMDRDDVNRTYLQPFMDYNLGSGLALGASAEIAGNWEADHDKWSGPVLLRLSKVTMLGKRPVKLQVAAGPSFGPDEGPDWRFRFQMNFLFPR